VQATRNAAWDWDLVTNRVVWGEGLETLLGHAPTGADPRGRPRAGRRRNPRRSRPGRARLGAGVSLPPGRRDLRPRGRPQLRRD
jgi:hypothetical protein